MTADLRCEEIAREDVPESEDEDWSCIDCGIPLEPGAPLICEECVDG